MTHTAPPGLPRLELTRRAAPVGVAAWQTDLLHDPLPDGAYDAVVSLSVLHHLSLDAVLPRLAVALPRVELPRDLPVEVVAAGAQAAVAVSLGVARFAGVRALVKHDAGMPVAAPELITRQVREQAQVELPGARVRRLLFWRYWLEWDRPIT